MMDVISISSTSDSEKESTPAERRNKLLQSKIRRSAQMFNLPDNITNSPARKIPKSILSDQKQKEIKLWESFFAQYDKNKNGEQHQIKVLDTSILNHEQKMFLTDAKDASSWIEDSNRFRRDAELYLKQIEFYRTGSGLVEKSLNYEIDSLTLDEYMKRTIFRDITE